jgi:putative nucleotidyltransferase with HDIG domain
VTWRRTTKCHRSLTAALAPAAGAAAEAAATKVRVEIWYDVVKSLWLTACSPDITGRCIPHELIEPNTSGPLTAHRGERARRRLVRPRTVCRHLAAATVAPSSPIRWSSAAEHHPRPTIRGVGLVKLTDAQRRTLEDLESRLDRIAVLPAVVSTLAALDPDADTFPDAVTELARRDPPFALRLLRLANQLSVRRAEAVDTIPQAIFRAGARRLADLVLTQSVVEVFVPRTRGQRHLWLHSIQVATAARLLARLRPEWGVNPEQAYAAGLLHDIGRFVLFEHRMEELGRIDDIGVGSPRELIEAEVQVCGFDHAELGWHVCQQWALPATLSALVRSHHVARDGSDRIPPEVLMLVRTVQLADCISFSLLRDPRLAQRSAGERSAAVAAMLHANGGAASLPRPVDLAEHLLSIEQDSRQAAAAVGVAEN